MVTDLNDPVTGNIAVAHDQCIGIRSPVMLHQPFLKLRAQQPLLLYLLLCHIMVNRIEPVSPPSLRSMLSVFDPDIGAVPAGDDTISKLLSPV